jgi:hypothetical protein
MRADREWVNDLRAHGDDLAGGFEARDVGRLRAAAVAALGLHDVREVDTGGADPDQVAVRGQLGPPMVEAEDQVRRPAVRLLDQGPHGPVGGRCVVGRHAANVGA